MEQIFLGRTDLEHVSFEYDKLKTATNLKPNTRTGNIIVDFFTLHERLHTKGHSGISFIDFYKNIDFYKEKAYIQKIYTHCENENKYKDQPEKRAKYIFNLYFGAINIFRPVVVMRILDWFPIPDTLLDPCAGWGGRLVGASIRGVREYIGIDTNQQLKKPYEKMMAFLKTKSDIKASMHFCDATKFDYSTIKYDMVLTSPPYMKKEIYTDMPEYLDFNREFYQPLFTKTWEHLEVGGLYILNIPNNILGFAKTAMGEPTDIRPFPKNPGRSQNNYKEYIYIWKKI